MADKVNLGDSSTIELLAEDYLVAYQEDDVEVIPTVAGLAKYIGTTKKTIERYRNGDGKEDTRLGTMIERIEDIQEIITVSKGLTGAFKPNVVAMILSKHGYSTKVDNVSSDGSMTPAKSFNDMYED